MSNHIIVKDIKLPKNAELHRFKNDKGVDCSAIYVDGKQILVGNTENEYFIIKQYEILQRYINAIYETY